MVAAETSVLSALLALLVTKAAPGATEISGHVCTLEDGSEWFLAHAGKTDASSMVVRLAIASKQPLVLVRVRLDVNALANVEDADSELPEGTGDARRFLVEPSGALRARDEELNDEPWYPAGDEYETVEAALRARTFGDRERVRATSVSGYLPADTNGLPPKLAPLRDAILQGGGYDFVTVQGQRMLRVTLPGGSKRMVTLSAEELELVLGKKPTD